MIREIDNLTSNLKEDLINLRRELHQYPEIGFDLSKTIETITQKLNENSIKYEVIENAGIVVNIGSKRGKTLLIRADMDALPSIEDNDLEYKSLNQNAHLCGHDIHSTILVGVAKVLKNIEDRLNGNVKLMFQPAEEIGQGAKFMIDNGILENPKVDAALALHVMPQVKCGDIYYKHGLNSASMDTWIVNVRGKSGHSSSPHLAIDPLYIVNEIYSSLNALVSKEVSPDEVAILTIGKMGGGTMSNIIPENACLEGGLRCFNEETRKYLYKRVEEIINSNVELFRGKCSIDRINTDSIYNDEKLTNFFVPYIKEILGHKKVFNFETPFFGTEDFSYISSRVPSMFFWLGAGHIENAPLHNEKTIFYEESIFTGVKVLSYLAYKWLMEGEI